MITVATPVRFDDPLPDAVDVVVIGAGIVGMATAYYLAKRGTSVLVCEKGRVAAEQSSRNWGWIRQQGRDDAELPIMVESNGLWRGLSEQTGEADLAFTTCGCVYIARSDAEMAKYEEWHDLARQHQLDTRMLSAAEADAATAGTLSAGNGKWVGGMVTPSDGRAEPFVAVPALARAAQALGVKVAEGCAVRTLDIEGGNVTGVYTERGRVATSRVLLAGGAWSSRFVRALGLDLPQLTVRGTVGRTHPADGPEVPNLGTPGLCIRKRADGGYSVSTGDLAEHRISPGSFRYAAKFVPLLRASARDVRLEAPPPGDYPDAFGAGRDIAPDQSSPFEAHRVLDPKPSRRAETRLRKHLAERAPALHAAGLAQVWSGMIDVTPDAVPYLTPVPSIEGLFVGTGMSGHGFGIGPGVGRVLADMVDGRPPQHDVTRFRFERFEDGSKIVPGPY